MVPRFCVLKFIDFFIKGGKIMEKVVMITGAKQGLGKACVYEFAGGGV